MVAPFPRRVPLRLSLAVSPFRQPLSSNCMDIIARLPCDLQRTIARIHHTNHIRDQTARANLCLDAIYREAYEELPIARVLKPGDAAPTPGADVIVIRRIEDDLQDISNICYCSVVPIDANRAFLSLIHGFTKVVDYTREEVFYLEQDHIDDNISVRDVNIHDLDQLRQIEYMTDYLFVAEVTPREQ